MKVPSKNGRLTIYGEELTGMAVCTGFFFFRTFRCECQIFVFFLMGLFYGLTPVRQNAKLSTRPG